MYITRKKEIRHVAISRRKGIQLALLCKDRVGTKMHHLSFYFQSSWVHSRLLAYLPFYVHRALNAIAAPHSNALPSFNLHFIALQHIVFSNLAPIAWKRDLLSYNLAPSSAFPANLRISFDHRETIKSQFPRSPMPDVDAIVNESVEPWR